jgi:DNA-directed RNA polymerase specialized sigma24 family protein
MTIRRFPVAEAADVLDISVEAVRGQIKRGTLVFMQDHKI